MHWVFYFIISWAMFYWFFCIRYFIATNATSTLSSLVSNYPRECWFFPQYKLRITSFHWINEINSRLVLYNIVTNLMPVGYIKKSTNYFKVWEPNFLIKLGSWYMIIVLCLIRKCLFKILWWICKNKIKIGEYMLDDEELDSP